MDSQGKVLIKLDEDAVRAAVADAVGRGVEAVAILFLHSYRNPAHEQRAKAIIAESHPDLFVTASHELSQEYREFERTSTAAANAYVGPRVRRYLGEMGDHLDAAGLCGRIPDRAIHRRPVRRPGGAERVHPDAGIRTRGGRDRHQGIVRSHRAQERHRLRHGRHHCQGRRHPWRPGADDRQRAHRRLRHRSARANADDRHPGGRHRRRLDRARRNGRRVACRSGKRGRAARPGVLWARRHRADHHRCQPHPRAAGRRPLSRRRDAPGRRRRPGRARSPRRRAARS